MRDRWMIPSNKNTNLPYAMKWIHARHGYEGQELSLWFTNYPISYQTKHRRICTNQ